MQLASLWLYQYQLCQLLRQCLRNFKQHLIKNETYLKNSHFINPLSLNPIQTGLFLLNPIQTFPNGLLYDWGGGGNCPCSLLAYISTITGARIVIQVCIERKFYTLFIY